MLIFKIIICVIVGFIGFYTFLQTMSLDELIKQASQEEKKALERIEAVALFSPLIIMFFVVAN